MSGEADGFRDAVVDEYAGRFLVQWQSDRVEDALYGRLQGHSVYEQIITKQRRTTPQCVRGEAITERFPVRENGLTFLVNFGEGLSTGVFLDQRENRRRLLAADLAGKTLLNCFAYTCAFSVAAAKAGAVTTSVDLSRRYLDWGKDNFCANALNTAAQEFLVGDVFEWLKRFAKRGRTWDIVMLDPPTFSTTKKGRRFQAARDYGELCRLAIPLVKKGGLLFASTNQRTIAPAEFEHTLRDAARDCDRVIASADFETLPLDFRVAEGERPYLKTEWVSLE